MENAWRTETSGKIGFSVTSWVADSVGAITNFARGGGPATVCCVPTA